MIPIHELLNRIRWDPEFAKGKFELGYYYRTETRINLVPLKQMTFRPPAFTSEKRGSLFYRQHMPRNCRTATGMLD